MVSLGRMSGSFAGLAGKVLQGFSAMRDLWKPLQCVHLLPFPFLSPFPYFSR